MLYQLYRLRRRQGSPHLKKNLSNEEGLTILELIIVVVAIAILSSIAIPLFANQQRSAIQAGMKRDVRNTHLNVATYLSKNPGASAAQLANWKIGSESSDWWGIAPPGGANYEVVASHSATTVQVFGTGYNNYTVRAWNIHLSPEASTAIMGDTDIYFASITGTMTVGCQPPELNGNYPCV